MPGRTRLAVRGIAVKAACHLPAYICQRKVLPMRGNYPDDLSSGAQRICSAPAGKRSAYSPDAVKAGIPAIVSVVQHPPLICGSQATGYQAVVAKGVLVAMNSGASAAPGKASMGPGVTIRPAAIPKGATVDFHILMKGGRPSMIVIGVGRGTPPDCAS